MERIEVRNADGNLSSGVKAVGYDAATNTLEVEFPSGGIYQYYGVPQSKYEEFMRASSKGGFFAAYIRAEYQCKCMNPKPKKEEKRNHGEAEEKTAVETPKPKKAAKARKRIS